MTQGVVYPGDALTILKENTFLRPTAFPASDSVFWVVPGTNDASRTGKAPSNRYRYQRSEYLVKAEEMANAGFLPGNVIGSVGFSNFCGGVGTLTGTLRIYMKNTSDLVYTLGNTWKTNGFTLVFSSSNYSVDVDQCVYRINLDPESPLTYTGGGLYIAWEFISQTGSPSTVHVFHSSNSGTESLHYGWASLTAMSDTLLASKSRPATFLSPVKDWSDPVRVTNIYTLEKMPVPYTGTQSIGVRVNNTGPAPQNFQLSLSVTDAASSAVKFASSQQVSLPGNSSRLIQFTGWLAEEEMKVIYSASTSPIAGETFVANNRLDIPGELNDSVFSINYNTTARSSWGFTYPDDGIFAIKFHMDYHGLVTGAYTRISYLTGSVGHKIKAVVLDSHGSIVGESPDFTIKTEDLDKIKYLALKEPAAFSNEVFYIGLYFYSGSEQWYGMTTGLESPLRSGSIYEFPPGGGQPDQFTSSESNAKWLIDAAVKSLVGVEETTASLKKPTLYPNPTDGQIIIDLGSGVNLQNVSVKVYGALGEPVINKVYQGTQTPAISLNGLPAGIYLVRVISDKRSWTMHVVKN